MPTAIYTAFEDDWEEILSKRSSDYRKAEKGGYVIAKNLV